MLSQRNRFKVAALVALLAGTFAFEVFAADDVQVDTLSIGSSMATSAAIGASVDGESCMTISQAQLMDAMQQFDSREHFNADVALAEQSNTTAVDSAYISGGSAGMSFTQVMQPPIAY
ncbi:hypothetical protein EXU30_14970 [Shewanella maritima]|uniref:Uncharacterized protein n=1 Tax=Shewanella maritima TaxID=2520507 RepID=A0A411PK15_9GAMM|nr:hypothetical protein [Shewanella maritima]QBF83834.1 hypothetical protein EXU30_14970 [Shewanella maritima]